MTGSRANLITEELFREAYQFEEAPRPSLKSNIARFFKCNKNTAYNFFPIARWLPKYSLKNDILNDIVAGMTVAVMHIPHGLAYAPLGRVEPVVGLYMAVFPVFVYIFLGTSRHISIGTFAVVCAMVGPVVQKFETPRLENPSANLTESGESERGGPTFLGTDIGAAVCLMVGVWEAGFGLLRLGSLTVIMSESLVSGFTTGAAIHVASYQLKNLFGVNVSSFSGPFKLVHIYIDFFSKIKTINFVTMSLSASCIFILLLFNELFKPLLSKAFPKNKIPLPIELIVILLGITCSYFLKLKDNYDVSVVGHIPTGFPVPQVPKTSLLWPVFFDSLIIALVALAVNLSLARIFAKKGFYTVSSNQEFFANGTANIVASFFWCLPSAASLSRSTIQFSVGGKTQLANLFSIALIVFILLLAGPLFEPVPYCVLSSIVVVTLKGLLMQMGDLVSIWRQSYWDGVVWLGTFLAVVILDLDYGLGVGIILSLMAIVFNSLLVRVSILGQVPNTNVFLDIAHYKAARAIPNILIVRVEGALNFSNYSKFESVILEQFKAFANSVTNNQQLYLVLNMSAVVKIDPTAVNCLRHIYKYLNNSQCNLYLTDCNILVYRMFGVCGLFKDLPQEQVLASVMDAVEYISTQL